MNTNLVDTSKQEEDDHVSYKFGLCKVCDCELAISVDISLPYIAHSAVAAAHCVCGHPYHKHKIIFIKTSVMLIHTSDNI